MNKNNDYYLASLIMSDLADSLKEVSEILLDISKRESSIDELTAERINEIREDVKNLQPETRWKYIKNLVNSGTFSLHSIKTRNPSKTKRIDKILELLGEGKTQAEIARELDCTRSNVSLHIKRHKEKTKNQ